MRTMATSFTLLAILHSQNSFAQVNGYIQIDIRGPIQYIVTDSHGRKVGYDPRTAINYNEIPYAYYDFSGVDSENPDIPALEVWEFGFRSSIEDPSFRESYTIEIVGTGQGIFTGAGGITQTLSGKGTDIEIKGVIDSAETALYTFTFSTDSTEGPTFRKIVTSGTLLQDLNNCFKLGLIKNQGLYTSLKQKANNAISQHKEEQDQSAVNLLQAFLHEVKAQTDKGIDKDAAAILTEDAQALIQQWKK